MKTPFCLWALLSTLFTSLPYSVCDSAGQKPSLVNVARLNSRDSSLLKGTPAKFGVNLLW
ncbi:hypothetical protein IC229_27720 [Spirosoma sp. BT702]|uniref:Fimbrial protein n=1 Tax=Spirosoma profusum TaxID=2771354 RepID=A0A927ATU8_9BACT|nr:hypothetical protein [Spirosoma profusum]MBD2704460.1 hypothetical protein [Spirosoma profusum]